MHSPKGITDVGNSCRTCKKKFKTLRIFEKHEKVHNPICDECSKNYESIGSLQLLAKEKHPKVKEYKCRLCPNFSFITEKEYLLHVREDHEGKIIECHMCSSCGKTFRTSSELSLHIKSKCGTEKNFVCKECGQRLMSPGSLYTHLKRHKGETTFMCRFCAKLFLTSGQLRIHERTHTKQKVFVCDDCGKGFCHRQSLITHISVHTGIKPYQCESCGRSFSCVGNLLKHRRSHLDTCGSIPMTSHRVQNPSTKIKVKINTPASSKLKRAQMKKEMERKFAMLEKESEKNEKCIEAGVKIDETKEFENTDPSDKTGPPEKTEPPEKAQSSEETVLPDEIVEFKVTNNVSTFLDKTTTNCSQEESGFDKHDPDKNSKFQIFVQKRTCQKKFQKRKGSEMKEVENFTRKRKVEQGDITNCKYCNKGYNNSRWLVKHEQMHKNNESEGYRQFPHKCSCCKMTFETKQEVKDHQQIAHADILACHDCGDKFFSKVDSLRLHQQHFHKGIPRKALTYICDKCGKGFKQRVLLTTHESTNCGTISQFQCNICHKQFSSHHTQKAHMRIHTSEKKLSCKFCGKNFHWKGQLKVHERSHTGEKPFTCLFCPSAFAYRDSLITHSTLHTGIKPYSCKCCGWRFSCIGNLAKHKGTHASTCGTWYRENEKDGFIE